MTWSGRSRCSRWCAARQASTAEPKLRPSSCWPNWKLASHQPASPWRRRAAGRGSSVRLWLRFLRRVRHNRRRYTRSPSFPLLMTWIEHRLSPRRPKHSRRYGGLLPNASDTESMDPVPTYTLYAYTASVYRCWCMREELKVMRRLSCVLVGLLAFAVLLAQAPAGARA